MPGVHLDFLSAAEAPEGPAEALGSPDSGCAESGLEAVIGDLLAQEEEVGEEEVGLAEGEEVEEQQEEEAREGVAGLRAMERLLRCAVAEVHGDLQVFGRRVDARLEEAAARVAPLALAVEELLEENLRLRTQQERLARQVEALCQALGLPESPAAPPAPAAAPALTPAPAAAPALTPPLPPPGPPPPRLRHPPLVVHPVAARVLRA
ncbi:smoothelin-like protein 2 [Anguilla rostrata]|uniref:smoothelin-like protein 2 n=1 Tax=Anguilla rostrata TaxID=7938 RepID=UPI0030D581AE